jgi:exonuclease III
MKIVEEDSTDILYIQEPYTIQDKIAGIPKKFKIFTSGEGRNRAAIVVTSNHIDTLLITQLSDVDAVVVEVIFGNLKIILANICFGIGQPIEVDLTKIDATLQHAKGASVLIAVDSNSRSTLWHDALTNTGGRILEEFLMSKQLYIMNEESVSTTFWNHRGASNIDLTVIINQLLRTVVRWEISEQESCSDHSIIRYVIG